MEGNTMAFVLSFQNLQTIMNSRNYLQLLVTLYFSFASFPSFRDIQKQDTEKYAG